MSASASVYTLAPPSPFLGERGADLALSGPPGSAEAKRLEHGPRLQGAGLVGRTPYATCRRPRASLLGAQQESAHLAPTPTPST